ncbi:hypothetical protein DL768_006471 [Monosporascus sp. mg162]|nr:hypothetical protein DL768_006471 [Monosporascus sp. mg162]
MSSSMNIDTPSEAEQASPTSSTFAVLAPYYAELLAALKSLMDTVARNKYCDAADVEGIKERLGVFAAKHYLPLRYNAHVAYTEQWKESITAVIPSLALACGTYGHLKKFESGSVVPGYEPQAEWFYGRWRHHGATFIKLRAEIGLLAEVKTLNDCREALGLQRVKR